MLSHNSLIWVQLIVIGKRPSLNFLHVKVIVNNLHFCGVCCDTTFFLSNCNNLYLYIFWMIQLGFVHVVILSMNCLFDSLIISTMFGLSFINFCSEFYKSLTCSSFRLETFLLTVTLSYVIRLFIWDHTFSDLVTHSYKLPSYHIYSVAYILVCCSSIIYTICF